jgi:C4-dicarboxylate-specific signal transduction histidine kinase
MSAKHVAVLLVEDNPADSELITEMLSAVPNVRFDLQSAWSLSGGLARLAEATFDVALLDLSLPDASGLEACVKVRARAPTIPIVVLTGLDDEELAVEALKQGAQDYLVKGHIGSNLLSRSLRYAIERNKVEVALQAARKDLERRVEERTAELRAANLRLQREMADRKVAEEKERQHREELAHVARLNTMGEMASSLAHEINQPLTAIVGYTRSCLRRLRSADWSADELVDPLEKAAAEAKRGGEIIRRLRKLVRKRESERLLFDVNEAAREVLAMIEPEARAKGATLQSNLTKDPLLVMADRVQVGQVILNLVRNGLEAMNDQDQHERQLTFETAAGDAGTIEVAVADCGPGGSIRDLDRLFEPFYSTKPEGLGLGLAISRTIIETHGGRLTAQPNSCGGLTFRFTLPAAGDAPASPTTTIAC